MLRGEKATLRGVMREDLPRLLEFANDIEVELAGGGDPPVPRTLEGLQKDFEREDSDPPRDRTNFAIGADGECIGTCGLFNIDVNARHAELGIARSGSRTCAACGSKFIPGTSAASGLTVPAVSWRRAGCGDTSGSADGTWIT